jgi:hypothetical protein
MDLQALVNSSRCDRADELCARIHRLEPLLPIHPPFQTGRRTPCLSDSLCLPAVHVLTGWHMLGDEGIVAWASQEQQLEVRSGACWNLWRDDRGAIAWLQSWRGAPADSSSLVTSVSCATKMLTWHPEYAGRYWSVATELHDRCSAQHQTPIGPACANVGGAGGGLSEAGGDVRLGAHAELIGTGGVCQEATPPFVMRALYGQHVRIVAALRSPVDRIETAFWFHKQFWAPKGASAAGLHAFAVEQVEEFTRCQLAHSTRRCAFLFERLGTAQAHAFWHCNQIIRGLYAPFVAEWRAAFGDALLVVRVEDVLDRPAATSARLERFLGLGARTAPARPAWHPAASYVRTHVASLNVSCCGGGRGPPEPMLEATRALLLRFYQPFNTQLAALLSDTSFKSWTAAR